MLGRPLAVRLDLAFSAADLLRESEVFGEREWAGHFNASNYSGDWSGVVFRGPEGAPGLLPSSPTGETTVADRESLDACPAVRAALATFECPLLSARFLRLGPGSIIREHSDWDLDVSQGKARIHIPIQTNDDVEFVVGGRRVSMLPGECWYLDLSLPHRVQNFSPIPRIHLVVDCELNPWLEALIADGLARNWSDDRLSQPGANFERFRQLLLNDPAWFDRAAALPRDREFERSLTGLGAEAGFRFSDEDVRAALFHTRNRWARRHQF